MSERPRGVPRRRVAVVVRPVDEVDAADEEREVRVYTAGATARQYSNMSAPPEPSNETTTNCGGRA
jgi:hypothetical protein